MRKHSRIVALLAAVAFLITALVPISGLAASSPSAGASYRLTASVPGDGGTPVSVGPDQAYTQVILGTTITLTAAPAQPAPSARETLTYNWNIPTGGGTAPQDASTKNSITVTPTAAGTYTYSVSVSDSAAANPSQRADGNPASITILVADQLKNATQATATTGQTVTLKAQWGEGAPTAPLAGLTYAWTALDGAPRPADITTTKPETTVTIPAQVQGEPTYTYTVTPSNSEYGPLTISIKVTNGLAAVQSSPLTWYIGSSTPPTLTATFTGPEGTTLETASWQTGSVWAENGTAPAGTVNTTGLVSTLALNPDDISAWTSPATRTFVCHATSRSGAVADAVVTVNIANPSGPTLTGSVSIGKETYATSAAGTACVANALTTSLPTLTVTATGGTSGTTTAGSGTDTTPGTGSGTGTTPGTGSGTGTTPGTGSGTGTTPGTGSGTSTPAVTYTYQWYETDATFNTAAPDALIAGATDATYTLLAKQLAATDKTAYFACVVTVVGNPKAISTQKFAITTVAQPSFQKDTADTTPSGPATTYPVNTDLTEPIVLAVNWNPPVIPTDVTGFTWTVTSAPSNGQISFQTGSGAAALVSVLGINGSHQTARGDDSVTVTKFSAAGTYVVSCLPISTSASRAAYNPVTFSLVAGAPSLPSDLVTYYSVQGNNGTVNHTPATPVSGNMVSAPLNSRVALYIPPASVSGPNADSGGIQTEWIMRRGAADNTETLPTGQGFYGINGNTLVTGPITSQMNGWQFAMRVSSQNDPSLNTPSPWVTLNVTGSSPTSAPSVTISSTPAAVASSVSVSAGGNVTFTATVTNTSSIPASNLSYQWYTQPITGSAQAISGATDATYTISSVNAAQDGQAYWCVVSNTGHMNEEGTSRRLTLSVNSQPGAVVISQPTGPSLTNVAPGQGSTFAVTATTNDGNAVSYQWYSKKSSMQIPVGTAITSIAEAQKYLSYAVAAMVPEGTSPTLTVPVMDPGVYEYTCRVVNTQNPMQFATSAPYYVAVAQASAKPVIVLPNNPINYVGGQAGQPLYLQCEAYLPTNASPTYQWQTASSSVGPWSDLGSYTESDLRIASLSDQNNGAYYRCVVTNPQTNDETESYPYQVSVWNPSDTPSITSNPQEVNYTIPVGNTSIPSDYAGDLQCSATSSNPSALVAQWQYRPTNGTWVNVPNSAYSGIGNPVTANGTSRLPLQANENLQAPSGEYRCVWYAGYQAANAPLVPQSDSLPAVVRILYPGHPYISAQPVGAAVPVGSAASFTVTADLASQGTLVYIWQTSSDRGNTWRNCISATDGTGQFTPTFQTYPVTQAMYDALSAASPGNLQDSIFMYRCIVANRALSRDVISEEVPLVVLPGQPSTPDITTGSGSSIQIVESGGATYAKGERLMAAGTSVGSFLRSLGYTAPAGYSVSVQSSDGETLAADALLCTGQKLVLKQTVTGETVDMVNVVVLGDVLGIGQMNLSQLVRVGKAFRGKDPLQGAYFQAALLTGKDQIQLSDVVAEAQLYKQLAVSASTHTPSPSATVSPGATASSSAAPTASPSATTSPSASATVTPAPSASASPSRTAAPSTSATATATASASPTQSDSTEFQPR